MYMMIYTARRRRRRYYYRPAFICASCCRFFIFVSKRAECPTTNLVIWRAMAGGAQQARTSFKPPLTHSRKRKRGAKPKAGSFEAFGLHPPIYNALRRKGYRLPTPVQRKAIPLVMAGACAALSRLAA